MGINGHLQRASFFVEVEPAQKEWWHFVGKLKCCGKAEVPKKKLLGFAAMHAVYVSRQGPGSYFSEGNDLGD